MQLFKTFEKASSAKKGIGMTHILFVCHGNICRSPMAEFIMKDLVQKAGLSEEIAVASVACTTEEIGHDTDRRARKKLQEKGIPVTPRRARLITQEDYDRADLILAMDHENLRRLSRLLGEDKAKKIRLLLSACGETKEVADPWYTGDFEETYTDILRGCRAVLEEWRKKKSV